jgi:magnesium/cobalt transport protein CorA
VDINVITGDGIEKHRASELPDLLTRTDAVIWVDIPACDTDAGRMLADVFGFHHLAVRDCVERNRVPKVHAYADHLFIVLHTPERGERGHVHYVELDQFVGSNYLVTVHGPVNSAVHADVALRETRAVLARIEAGRLRPATPFELSHAIVSAMARSQEDYVETVTTDVWRLEQRVTGGQVGDPEDLLNDLFRARHGLLAVRTMATLGGAAYGRVTKLPDVATDVQMLVGDIADRFDRVRAVADGQREYLQGVIEFYQTMLTIKSTLIGQAQNEEVKRLTEASYTQNEEIKKISAWAAIFFAPTLIGTVYGMNFDHMPELHWIVGYPLALLAMALSSVVLYAAFRRRGWL